MTNTKFILINRRHKKQIDSITRGFPLYCDFQFSNLLSWSSHKHPTKFSVVDGNLVVRMKEYSTERVITMFMGKHNVMKCISDLTNEHLVLERVPQEVVAEIEKSTIKDFFEISEDINNHDYVLNLEHVVNPTGKKLKSKRRLAKAFERNYPDHKVILLKPIYKSLMPILKQVFRNIANEKGVGMNELADELEALGKLLKHQKLFKLIVLGVTYRNMLIGFTINEIMKSSKSDTALGCFGKGLRKYKGIYAYLEVITAKYLLKKNIKYINIEEDMGSEGLRESKRLWRPIIILKKYIIAKKV